jgi:hypothetical protein
MEDDNSTIMLLVGLKTATCDVQIRTRSEMANVGEVQLQRRRSAKLLGSELKTGTRLRALLRQTSKLRRSGTQECK